MQLQGKKWLATLTLGAMGTVGANVAQAQVTIHPYLNISVGAPLVTGTYGRIQFDPGVPVPPLYSPTPVLIRRPVVNTQPVYMYVPTQHRQNWASYCGRYNACQMPVYFVNAAAVRRPRVVTQQVYRQPVVANRPVVVREHWDNGKHKGWYKKDNGKHKGWYKQDDDDRRGNRRVVGRR
ncbi:MAG: hypothetical protein Q4G39_08820 [Brachymonas sp.]|nr:hypothetical protein [Brachymonas sp.]